MLMSNEMKKFIGILPAAGLGSRLLPSRYPKELLPVFFIADNNNEKIQPRVVAEYSLKAMKYAEIQLCLLTISDRKTEIMRYFGDGTDIGVNIAYLHQMKPSGLTNAIDLGFHWFGDNCICLALPDTIFSPFTAISTICQEMIKRQSDLILGVFPTQNPEQLGPVRIESDGSVSEVLEKPSNPDIYNTWGIAAWTPRFTQFFHDVVSSQPQIAEKSIGYIFNLAVIEGLKVDAVFFPDGKYIDLGTPEGIGTIIHHQNILNF